MKILFDGDIFLYKHCKNAEEIFSWGDDIQTLVSDSKEARQKMEINLIHIQKQLEAWLGHSLDIIVCFSGADNWRKLVLPSYKSKRIGGLKPISFKPVKDWFVNNYDTRLWYGLEADDTMGILATTDRDDCIVVSSDKDLKGIPGYLFNPDKDEHPHLTTLEAADHWHMMQSLMGDLVDGYKGCPSYGPKKAYRALGPVEGSTLPDLWERLIKAYTAHGISVEDATVQATVARILRKDEWNFEERKCLWKPPNLPLAPVEIPNVPCVMEQV